MGKRTRPKRRPTRTPNVPAPEQFISHMKRENVEPEIIYWYKQMSDIDQVALMEAAYILRDCIVSCGLKSAMEILHSIGSYLKKEGLL